jgi:hypothetical protein
LENGTVFASSGVTLFSMKPESEDEEIDAPANFPRDLSRPVRRLALAILIQALHDLNIPKRAIGARIFLRPGSPQLKMYAELAGVEPQWLHDRLARKLRS